MELPARTLLPEVEPTFSVCQWSRVGVKRGNSSVSDDDRGDMYAHLWFTPQRIVGFLFFQRSCLLLRESIRDTFKVLCEVKHLAALFFNGGEFGALVGRCAGKIIT